MTKDGSDTLMAVIKVQLAYITCLETKVSLLEDGRKRLLEDCEIFTMARRGQKLCKRCSEVVR